MTGTEARVIYHRHPDRGLSRWAPTVDLERDPRWGRTEEGYGEDPVLTGVMSSAYIQGMQGMIRSIFVSLLPSSIFMRTIPKRAGDGSLPA